MKRKFHVRCEAGENLEITSKSYLSLYIVIDCGQALLKNGYSIRIFNTINFRKSMHYNPFAYIHSEKDILKLTTTLIANTKGDGKAGDEFWTSATRSQTVKSLRTSNGFPLFGELVV